MFTLHLTKKILELGKVAVETEREMSQAVRSERQRYEMMIGSRVKRRQTWFLPRDFGCFGFFSA